jgi:hypothetical protein
MVESIPSINIAPYPTNKPESSLSSCFDEVPEPTIEWKPESAPHAMTRGIVGQKGEGTVGATTFADQLV